MKIGDIGNSPFSVIQNNRNNVNGEGFTEMLKDFITDVNNKQNDSSNKTEEFIQGGDVEIHEVMIAGEKAKTSLELLMQIRNKTIDMYKELNRMQV